MRATSTPSPPALASSPLSSSAARAISVGLPAAPACTIAVWPSREIETPDRGCTTAATCSLSRSRSPTRESASLEPRRRPPCAPASGARPSAPSSRGPGTRARRVCAPGPTPSRRPPSPHPRARARRVARAGRAGVRGATQASATSLPCVAVQRPSRPSGLTGVTGRIPSEAESAFENHRGGAGAEGDVRPLAQRDERGQEQEPRG